jgi:hypothetical protein
LEFLSRIDLKSVLIGGGIFVAGVALSIALAAAVLVRMPADYFQGDGRDHLLASRPPWKRILLRVGKNALGVLLVVLGVVLSVPGVPGQGFLTILIGLTLIDFPGKRKLEIRIMRNHMMLAGANAIRRRFHKAPFELDPAPAEALSSKQTQ